MAEIKKFLDIAALGTLVDQIKAEDARILAEAKDYTDKASYDVAGSAATAESNAKTYADTQVAALANGQVKLNKEAIEKLNGSASTEGSVAKAVADSAATLQASIDSVSGVANQNAIAIAAINNAESGILKQAKDYADGQDAVVQGSVNELAEYVGEFTHATAQTVVEYIDAKTAGIATSDALDTLGSRVTVVEGEVAAIKGDYLKGSDKTELEGKIAEVQTAVNTEQSRAEGVESGLDARIKAVEDDYLKAADKTELQGNINTVSTALERLTNGVSADEIDGVNDLINYVNEHGAEVISMQEDIAQNALDIDAVEGRLDTAEGKIEVLEGSVATKVEQSVYDAKVAELEGADTAIKGRLDTAESDIAALEAALGESGSVAEDIATAKQEAINAAASDATSKANQALVDAKAYADTEDAKIEQSVATLQGVVDGKAAQSDVEALAGRVSTAEGEIDTLQSKMDAVEAKAHEHANADVLNGVTSEKVNAWDAAEGNAKTYADGLNTAMDSRVEALEEDIHTHSNKDELDLIVSGDKAKWDAAVASINSFVAITSAEVEALFASAYENGDVGEY